MLHLFKEGSKIGRKDFRQFLKRKQTKQTRNLYIPIKLYALILKLPNLYLGTITILQTPYEIRGTAGRRVVKCSQKHRKGLWSKKFIMRNEVRNMKKFMKALMAGTLAVSVLSMAACTTTTTTTTAGGGDATTKAPDDTTAATEEATEGGSDGDLIKVAIINNDPNESGYRTANDRDMKETFTEENGYEAYFYYSLKNEDQIAAAEKYIQDEVDYLLISAAGTSGWDGVLEDAQEAGIKVILFDRTIDADESLYEASIVSDMAKEGQQAVDWLASQGLDEYKIIHIQGVMGSSAQIGRSGALDEMVAANDNWSIVTQQTAEWSEEAAQQIVQSVIDSGETFNVIYAENDNMAKGAVAALDKANISHGVGKDVIIIGFDCNTWALEELLAGNWNYDGQCNPFQAAYIDDIIKNGVTTKVVIMDEKGFDATTITQEDVDNYGI